MCHLLSGAVLVIWILHSQGCNNLYLFPEYKAPSHVDFSSSKPELQQEMESKMTQLKQDLASVKQVHAESKIMYFQLTGCTYHLHLVQLRLAGFVQKCTQKYQTKFVSQYLMVPQAVSEIKVMDQCYISHALQVCLCTAVNIIIQLA